MARTRHRSLNWRGGGRFFKYRGLAHTDVHTEKNTEGRKWRHTENFNLKRFDKIELPAKLLTISYVVIKATSDQNNVRSNMNLRKWRFSKSARYWIDSYKHTHTHTHTHTHKSHTSIYVCINLSTNPSINPFVACSSILWCVCVLQMHIYCRDLFRALWLLGSFLLIVATSYG